MAKGKFISRMDADDWAFPDKLALKFEFLKSNPTYQVVSGLVDIKHIVRILVVCPFCKVG